jgi:hypothetical protein
MTVLLSTQNTLPEPAQYDFWCSIGNVKKAPDPTTRLPGLAILLNSAAEEIAGKWLAIGKELAETPSAILAHAPACAANASDFGRMLAWTKVIENWAANNKNILVICEDPWIFRLLAEIPGVQSSHPPSLLKKRFRLFWRGYLARIKISLELFRTSWLLRKQHRVYPQGAKALLVYGHPNSTKAGIDGYFGDLMNNMKDLCRIFHVDCRLQKAKELTGDGRNFSLHAWGNPFVALTLIFTKWRPSKSHQSGRYGWLVRRAAAIEGGTGQPAMIRWQQICQKAWLNDAKPSVVAWPWENHAWERNFVRLARTIKTKTIGYQHATVGKQELNYSPVSNPDGAESLPEHILTSGPASLKILEKLGVPAQRLTNAGSFRTQNQSFPHFDRSGPIFLALPFDSEISAEMVEAVRSLGAKGRKILVKPHPMTPYFFTESEGVEATSLPLDRQKSLAAVIYSATTVGLEAVLGGLPTLEFLPSSKSSMDVLPDGISVPSVTADSLAKNLLTIKPPPPFNRESIFSPIDIKIWKSIFSPEQLV